MTRTPLIAVETAMHIYFSFIYLLGFETAFLPSKYQTGGVPRIPSVVSDPWKRKSRPKKNEYFEYLSKATAKKKICSKYFQTKKKTYFDHPRDLESGQGTPSPSPPPLCRVKILSSPGPMSHSQGSILSCCSKELAE